MSFSKNFALKKLENTSEFINELDVFLKKTTDDVLLSDSEKMHVAERLVQLIVDGMIEINQYFMKELNLKSSDDFLGTFMILGENNILPIDFATKIAPVTGVRNILVHQYEKVDKGVFLKNLRNHFSDFVKYKDYVSDYIKNMPVEN